MCRAWIFALVALVVAATFTASAGARRTGGGGHSRHSYPSHGGLSGSGNRHTYPASNGLSGSGGAHTQHHSPSVHAASAPAVHSYPQSSSGLSGSGGHNSNGGLSGSGHVNSNVPSYPKSPGLSGNGNSHPSSPHNVHYHQHVYNPPPTIHYTPAHGPPPAHPYPVYHGPPPVYVHEFRDSGSKFSTLITGLALYNLGRHASGSNSHHAHQTTTPQQDNPGEHCTLSIEQDKSIERVKIPCYIVSTFQDLNDVNKSLHSSPATAVTTVVPNIPSNDTATAVPKTVPPTVSNDTAVNVTSGNNNISLANVTTSVENNAVLENKTLIHNGTVLQNVTDPVKNLTETAITTTASPASVNATQKPPEAVDAEQVKGEPIKLKQDARCFVEKKTKNSFSKKEIECGLLQQYALQSMQKQRAHSNHVHSHSNAVTSGMYMFSLFTVSTLSSLIYLSA